MLKVLDLFSGIGGFSLGLERTGGFETVAFCEIEEFPRRVLAKHWPDVPIYEDVRTLNADGLGRIDCVVGGYPCQPFSHAGKRNGAEDDRHLWPEMLRIVASVRPRWVIAENVAGHISMGLDEVLSDLESKGYTAWPLVIPACAVDAPHRRDRVWIVANDDSQHSGASGPNQTQVTSTTPIGSTGKQPSLMADAEGECRRAGLRQDRSMSQHGTIAANGRCDARWQWLPEPGVGRVADGVSSRVDRLKGLGNAVVPQIPEMIGRAILEAEGI